MPAVTKKDLVDLLRKSQQYFHCTNACHRTLTGDCDCGIDPHRKLVAAVLARVKA